jgi:replication factor A1
VTFWDRFATSDGGPEPSPGDQLEQALGAGARPVVALKSVRVGDFNGKNLGSLGSSTVLVNPDRPEAQQLRAW